MDEAAYILGALALALVLLLSGCAASRPATGVYSGNTRIVHVKAPKLPDGPAGLDKALISRPVEVRIYAEPVAAPAMMIREIELGPKYATFRGLQSEIQSLMPTGNETKTVWVDTSGVVHEAVTGAGHEAQDVRAGFFTRLFRIMKYCLWSILLIFVGVVVLSITKAIRAKRKDDKLGRIMDIAMMSMMASVKQVKRPVRRVIRRVRRIIT